MDLVGVFGIGILVQLKRYVSIGVFAIRLRFIESLDYFSDLFGLFRIVKVGVNLASFRDPLPGNGNANAQAWMPEDQC